MGIFQDMVERSTEVVVQTPPNSLGIARKLMPQIAPERLDDFLSSLQVMKIDVRREWLEASRLRATQGEMNADKIQQIIDRGVESGATPLLVSSDDFILDGHHRWAATCNVNPRQKIEVWRIRVPIRQLLRLAHDFEGVAYKDIHEQQLLKILSMIWG